MVTHNHISRGGACGSQYGWLVALGVATLLYACCLQVTVQGNTTTPTTPTNTTTTEISNANAKGAVCQNDTCGQGTCNVTNGTAVCTCDFGWKGDNCSQGIPCQNDTCDHGSCTNTSGAAVCTCDRGWTGSNCSQGIMCQNDTCVHGSCKDTSGTAVCTCQQGWTGYNCSQGIPCLNDTCAHGTCNETSGTAVCTCAVGWIGYNCSQGIPCRNDTCVHGTCNDRNGPAACTCDQGWTGTNCSEDVDECGQGVCQHGGLCENRVGSYNCVCHSGWTGLNCHEDVDECNATVPKCSQLNEGCVNTNGSYTCQCNTGYERLKPASACQETVLVPYATNTTQRQWEDDAIFGPFPIPYGFMHGSTVIMQYYVSTNGYLTFNSPFSQPTMPDLASPRLRPLSFLAPYWADVDIPQANTTSGLYHVAISLEQTSGSAELKELFERYSKLPVLKDFAPVFIAVVTWKDVLPYKAEDFPKLDPATVQVLVATDGRRVRVRAAWRSVWSRLAYFNVSALMHWAGDDTPLTWTLTDIPARQNFTYPASSTTKPVTPCVQWLSAYGQQLRDTGNDGVACPCSLAQAQADPLFRVNLTQSPVCAVSHVFHPRTGRKKTCCYGPVSPKMLSTEVWYPSIPELKDAGNSSQVRRGFEQCCSDTAGTLHPTACTRFRRLFPVDQCDAYRAPLAALVWGSGHIITADKVQYTVNPWGEFLLLRFNDTTANSSSTPLEVQGRWQETADAGVNLTALTGIALKYGDQPPMSIYTINQQLKFYVNGQEKTQADSGLSSDIALMTTGNDTLDMVFPSGVTVKAKVSGSHMSLTFTAMTLGNLSEVKGLLVARSVSSNLTTSNPLQRLTQAKIWSLTQNESLFAYNVSGRGDNFTSTQRPDFQPASLPSTAAELLAELNRTNQTGEAMCGGSVVCLHDLLATGNATTAQRTKTAEEDFRRMVQTLGQRPPVFNVTTQVLNVSVSAGVSPLPVSVSPEVTNSSLYPNVTLTVEGQPDTVTLNYTFVKTVNPAGWMFRWYPDNKVRNLTFLTLTFTATSAVTGMTSVYRPTVVMCGCERLAQCDYSGTDQMVAAVSRRIAGYYVAQCRCDATKGGRFCQDDVSVCDVCYDASLCNSNATDNNTCQCPQGYVGNGLKCYERDECQRGDRCEHRCNNTRGSFVCSCNTGFSLVANGRCQDRDECVAREDNCTSAQFCENTVGSFVCPCRPRFGGENCQLRVKYRYGGELKFRSIASLGQGWTDDLRQPHTRAFMQLASKVIAIVGNTLRNENVSFVDVTVLSFSPVNTARRRRSASATSAPSAIVTNFVVSTEQAEDAASLKEAFKAGFDPVCISGLCRYSGGKVVLYEVDKATAGFKADYDLCVSDRTNVCHNTSTLCTTTNGTTTCRCRQGYRPWTLYDNICQDKDECAENRSLCGVSATNSSLCRNTDGSYFCLCPPSLAWDGATMQCVAVTLKDVCSERKPCLHGAECVNTMDSASYACRCTDGWTGPTCADEDGEASRYKWTMIGVAIGLGVLCLIFLIIIIVVCVMRTRSKSSDSSYETNSPKYADFRRRGSDAAVHDATNGNNIQRFSNPAYMDDGDLISKRL